MIAVRTLDYGIIIGLLADKQLFSEISEDGIDSYIPDVINEYWVLITDKELVGAYRVHQVNSITYQIHAFLLPEQRDKSKESGKVILEWCIENLEFNKLIAEIPKKYENVYRFTKGMGFKDEGINRESFLKDGKIWDTYRLGQTKKEIEQWLAQ